MNSYINLAIQKILENISSTTTNGIIVASPSLQPNYQFHWIRDSALVIRVIIEEYKNTTDSKYIKILLDYIEIENTIQGLITKGGLGEPKINKDGTAFNGDWGRPQNDGPALRGIMLVKILNIFKNDYELLCSNTIIPMIRKDLNYILKNYNQPCFDLWEENYGWHWYTRMVQLKFLKDSLKMKEQLDIDETHIKIVINELTNNMKDHICDTFIISSFDINGNIIKHEDSANLLAFSHIEYDKEILKIFPLKLVLSNMYNLIDYFRNKYNNQTIYSIGRYKNDKYFDGQAWVICSLALGQICTELYNSDNKLYNNLKKIPNQIIEKILSLSPTLILAEQYNPNTNEFCSADKLTWNYSELYTFIKLSQKYKLTN